MLLVRKANSFKGMLAGQKARIPFGSRPRICGAVSSQTSKQSDNYEATYQGANNKSKPASCEVRQKSPHDHARGADQFRARWDNVSINDGEVLRLEPDAEIAASLARFAVQLHLAVSPFSFHGWVRRGGTYDISKDKGIPPPLGEYSLECLKGNACRGCFTCLRYSVDSHLALCRGQKPGACCIRRIGQDEESGKANRNGHALSLCQNAGAPRRVGLNLHRIRCTAIASRPVHVLH